MMAYYVNPRTERKITKYVAWYNSLWRSTLRLNEQGIVYICISEVLNPPGGFIRAFTAFRSLGEIFFCHFLKWKYWYLVSFDWVLLRVARADRSAQTFQLSKIALSLPGDSCFDIFAKLWCVIPVERIGAKSWKRCEGLFAKICKDCLLWRGGRAKKYFLGIKWKHRVSRTQQGDTSQSEAYDANNTHSFFQMLGRSVVDFIVSLIINK